MKFGDIVRVRSDLIVGRKYGYTTLLDGMVRYRGEKAKITFICDDGDVQLDHRFYWSPEMLEQSFTMLIHRIWHKLKNIFRRLWA